LDASGGPAGGLSPRGNPRRPAGQRGVAKRIYVQSSCLREEVKGSLRQIKINQEKRLIFFALPLTFVIQNLCSNASIRRFDIQNRQ